MPEDKHIPIGSGSKLAPFTWDKIFDQEYMGKLASLFNSLANCPQLQLSENNSKIAIPAAATNHWRGEYIPTAAAGYYKQYDLVFVSTGVNSGTYLFVAAAYSTNDYPWLGAGKWIKFPSTVINQWM